MTRVRISSSLRGAEAYPDDVAAPRLLTPHAFAPEPERTTA